MKKTCPIPLTLILFFMSSCSPTYTGQSAAVSPAGRTTPSSAPAQTASIAVVKTVIPVSSILESVTPSPELLAEFGFSQAEDFSMIQPPKLTPAVKTNLGPVLPVDPEDVLNIAVSGSLLIEQKSSLWQDGFVVFETGDKQFSDVRKHVSEIYGQPYYLTTDAAFHALHLTFDELLKAMEKEHFLPLMKQITAETLTVVKDYRRQLAGSSLEEDAALAEAYLSLGLKLFDPSTVLNSEVEKAIQPQLEQIQTEGGRDQSALIPGFEDDYSAYRPVGHYAGDSALENYFRGMTWFGRVQFQLSSQKPNFKPSHAPLIITLALRQKGQDGSAPAEKWGKMHEVLSMMIGPVDDGGPLEYSTLMDRIYGQGHTLEALKDESLWRQFIDSQAALPAPQINSTFANSLTDMESEHGWRFSGQRFTMDAFFLQNLVYDRVGTRENPRKLPSGLDVMAILGSAPADRELEESGETAYAHYPEQQTAMKSWMTGLPGEKWWETFYSTWLYAFQGQVSEKGDAFPPYMRSLAWGYKELNSALGSWAELKHDTSLYAKMPEYGAGGGPPSSGPAPAFVEPNPEVFYRLAYAVQNLADGLILHGMNVSIEDPQPGDFTHPMGVEGLIDDTAAFGRRLQELGDIASRELAGQTLTQDDFEVIQGCLGPVECQVILMQNMHEHGIGPSQEMPPLPVVAAVAGADDKLLQVGVGNLNRIFVIVPLEGSLQIAQGNVFSYYEFVHPRADRLTDQVWRELLVSEEINPPEWAGNFLNSGGVPVDVLAFRVGDWYLVTEAGDDLNVRKAAWKTGGGSRQALCQRLCGNHRRPGNCEWRSLVENPPGLVQ
ncbi:MAG: DUF3160 domain-containing protein [Anaerolineaceae bacterium]